MTRDNLRKEIEKYLDERRLPHVLGVEKESLELSEIFGLSSSEKEKLACAALLHDITKKYTKEQNIDLMKKRGLKPAKADLENPKVLHAVTGALLAEELFPETADSTVISAIRYHTTGKENMSLTEKLLYLADYIEPTRTFDDCVRLRKFFYGRLDSGDRMKLLNDTLIFSFDMTIESLLEEGAPIHPDTVAARNYLITEKSTNRKFS